MAGAGTTERVAAGIGDVARNGVGEASDETGIAGVGEAVASPPDDGAGVGGVNDGVPPMVEVDVLAQPADRVVATTRISARTASAIVRSEPTAPRR